MFRKIEWLIDEVALRIILLVLGHDHWWKG